MSGYLGLNLKSESWRACQVCERLNNCEETMENHFWEDQDYNLWVRLHQARDTIFRAREKELIQYGFTAMQAAVLFVLKVLNDTEEKATPNKVAKWLLREPHTISKLLTRMENEGLVNKTRSSGQGNEINITLTEEGEQAYKQSLKRESIREITSCLSEEERQQLSSSLEKLRDKALEQITPKNKVPFP